MHAFVPLSPVTLRYRRSRSNDSFLNSRQVVCKSVSSSKTSRSENSALSAAAATFVLKKAAAGYTTGGSRPPATTASSALLQLEREQKRNKVSSDVDNLYGQWRLVLTANPKAKLPFTKALYFPLRAHQTFIKGKNGQGDVFDNGVFWFGKAAFFRLSGPMRWVGKRNRLEFGVDRLKVSVAGKTWEKKGLDKEGESLEGRTAKTLPFFTFFLIRPDIACARGRSGGLALYARVPDEKRL